MFVNKFEFFNSSFSTLFSCLKLSKLEKQMLLLCFFFHSKKATLYRLICTQHRKVNEEWVESWGCFVLKEKIQENRGKLYQDSKKKRKMRDHHEKKMCSLLCYSYYFLSIRIHTGGDAYKHRCAHKNKMMSFTLKWVLAEL